MDGLGMLPYLAPFFFVGTWCLTLRIIAGLSGWRRLARHYAFDGRFTGKVWRFRSARLGRMNFNGALTIGVDRRGLFLAPMILFRPFHRPLLIPWSEIEAEPHKSWLFKGRRLTFRSVPQVQMLLSEGTFASIIAHLESLPDLPE